MYVHVRKGKRETTLVLRCGYKDRLTKQHKVKVKTFKVPSELTGKKEIEAFRRKCEVELKEEVDKIARGVFIKPKTQVVFIEFAEEFVEKQLRENPTGLSHYVTNKSYLKILREKFGLLTLDEMTLPVILDFCNWLRTRTRKVETTVVKKSLSDVIASTGKSMTATAKSCGIAHTTLSVALSVGSQIKRETAKTICSHLNVSFKDYFKLEQAEERYSQSSNRGVKNLLHSVLQEAVTQMLIETNYASRSYTKDMTGTKSKKEIFDNMDDIRDFILAINKEKDIRKQIAFKFMIYTGLRVGEIAGLEWNDIDFVDNKLYINRNCRYQSGGFGIITKTPKTSNSQRVLPIPLNLQFNLLDYKNWWDEQKIIHGDLWANTNRLFCQNNGNDMAGSTIATWLRDFQSANNFKKVTPHGLRHTYISMLVTNGVDPKTASELAGHSNIQTTLKYYTHSNLKAKREAADKVNDMLKVI